MSRFAESTVEDAALSYLADLGYAILHGPAIAPDEPRAERASYDEVVLAARLEAALARLNPHLPSEARDEAFRKVLRVESPSLLARNRAFHRMLVDGVEVEYQRDGRIVGDRARLVDFDDPAANDWLAVNQYTVIESRRNRRADVVLFVNGLPLAVFELKDASDEGATIHGAFNQLQTYKADIPSLFAFNEALVVSDGLEARIGSLSAEWQRFMPWRTVEGDVLAPAVTAELEVLVNGVFERRRFLDLVRHFVAFEEERGILAKKIAGYHQFHAVNRAVETTLRAATVDGDRRAGVVWHTQGSGKSLTMTFFAGRIVLALDNPTLVVITDRNDLDEQLFGTFARCQDLLRQTPVRAESSAHLRALLAVASGGVVFTTVQKFLAEDDPTARRRALSERRNVVVIADEAHRSQYDFIDGFARRLRDALPNATFIGFTGTPIEMTDRNTRAVFGEYISVYDIQQAVADKATVPIFYESRLAKLELRDEERPRLDEGFEEVTEGEEAAGKEKLKTKWAALEALVGTDKRLGLVARDVIDHFEARLSAMDGKGLIVCMSRRICVELYDQLVRLRPEWHDADDDKGAIKVVMTGSASDPLAWQPHIRNKARREDLARCFKDPGDPFRIAIVRDMWLTGFDVPSLHTMYADKPMRGHGLMQAIARVNRVYRDKPGGLVVDYLGLADQLRRALADYTGSGGRGKTAIDQAEAVAVMLEKHEVAAALFHGFDRSGFFRGSPREKLAVLRAALEHVLAQEDGKARLLRAVTQLSAAFALSVPHEEALRIRDDVAFFQACRAALVKATPAEGRKTPDEMEHAIRQLVSQAIVSEGVVDIFAAAGLPKPDVSLLSEGFLAEVRALPEKNLAVELLERLLRDEVKTRSRKNLVQSRRFSDMLERTLRAYQNRAIEAAQVIEQLIEIAREMREARRRGDDLRLSEDELAFYDALETNDSAVAVLGDETLRKIAQELTVTVRSNTTIDWTEKETVRARLRVMAKRVLRKYGYPPDKQEQATQTVLEQAALLSSAWALEPEPPGVRVLPRAAVRPFQNALPLYSLRAAAGRFGGGQDVEEEGWVEVSGIGSLDEQMFLARVAGRSMEPRLRDGDIAVFRSNPVGSRNGKIVLAEYRGPADPDTGGSYTVKRYRSEKRDSDGSWEHGSIALEPLNPDFVPIVVSPADAEDLRIVAELVEVLPRA